MRSGGYDDRMSIVIRRCVKKAGLIARARTFRLECDEQGLYVLCLGRATGEMNFEHLTSLERAAAKLATEKALSYYGDRYEKEHVQAEDELARVGAKAFASRPHCWLIPRGAGAKVALDASQSSVRVRHGKVNLELFLSPPDFETMKEIARQLA